MGMSDGKRSAPASLSGNSNCSRDELTALLIKKSRPCTGATTARPETPGTFRQMRVAPRGMPAPGGRSRAAVQALIAIGTHISLIQSTANHRIKCIACKSLKLASRTSVSSTKFRLKKDRRQLPRLSFRSNGKPSTDLADQRLWPVYP
jgi:hypothetical protein